MNLKPSRSKPLKSKPSKSKPSNSKPSKPKPLKLNYLLGDDMVEAIAIEDMILPANKTSFDFETPIKIHPRAAAGEQSNIMVFRPIIPDINPPKGANTIEAIKSMDANQDA